MKSDFFSDWTANEPDLGDLEVCPYCHNTVDVHVDQTEHSWVYDQPIHLECYNKHEREQNDEQRQG